MSLMIRLVNQEKWDMKLKIATTLLILIIFSSCSYKSVVLSNLEHFVTNRVNKELKLDISEKKVLKEDIITFLEGSKPHLLKISKRLEQFDLKKSNIKEDLQRINETYYSLALQFNPILAKRLARFDTIKSNKFINQLKDKNTALIEKLLNRYLEDYIDRYEYFFDDLTKEQEKLIENTLTIYKNLSKIRINNRVLVQKKLERIFQLEEINQREREILKILNLSADKRVMIKEQIYYTERLKKFINTLTAQQFSFFDKRIVEFNEWIKIFLETDYK
jgi:hypothetical protein